MLIPLPSPSQGEKPSKLPRTVQLLIIVNVLVFGYQLYYWHFWDLNLSERYGIIPQKISDFVLLFPQLPDLSQPTLITSLFLHDTHSLQGGFIHLLGNMLYLSAFGPNLEQVIGRVKFLLFYLLCGALAALFYVVFHYNSDVPLIGASGAIAGVMGAHLMACPKSRIRCLFLIYIVSLPAIVVLIPWILVQVFNFVYLTSQDSAVAWMAHIGGFLAGVFFINRFQLSWLPRKHGDTVSLTHKYSNDKIPLMKVGR